VSSDMEMQPEKVGCAIARMLTDREKERVARQRPDRKTHPAARRAVEPGEAPFSGVSPPGPIPALLELGARISAPFFLPAGIETRKYGPGGSSTGRRRSLKLHCRGKIRALTQQDHYRIKSPDSHRPPEDFP
jgi:hypothetical protein